MGWRYQQFAGADRQGRRFGTLCVAARQGISGNSRGCGSSKRYKLKYNRPDVRTHQETPMRASRVVQFIATLVPGVDGPRSDAQATPTSTGGCA